MRLHAKTEWMALTCGGSTGGSLGSPRGGRCSRRDDGIGVVRPTKEVTGEAVKGILRGRRCLSLPQRRSTRHESGLKVHDGRSTACSDIQMTGGSDGG